jgi:hypothetical protein
MICSAKPVLIEDLYIVQKEQFSIKCYTCDTHNWRKAKYKHKRQPYLLVREDVTYGLWLQDFSWKNFWSWVSRGLTPRWNCQFLSNFDFDFKRVSREYEKVVGHKVLRDSRQPARTGAAEQRKQKKLLGSFTRQRLVKTGHWMCAVVRSRGRRLTRALQYL